MSQPTSRYMIRSFEKQFPGLFQWKPTNDGNRRATRTQPLVRQDVVETMQIRQMTPELMATVPKYNGATGNLVDLRDDDAIFLLRADMSVIGEVKQEVYIHHNEAHSDATRENGESVGEAIVRLNCVTDVAYILRRHSGFVVENHYSVGGYEATLYKLPNGWSVTEWIKTQLVRADKQLLTLPLDIAAVVVLS